jgi:intracellular septation protein A
MNNFGILVGIIPVVAFVCFDLFLNPKKAVVATMVVTVLAFFAYWLVFRDFDTTMFLELGLLFALGFLSLRLGNSIYFKYQPAVVGLALFLFLMWFEVQGDSYFLRFKSVMERVSPETAHFFTDEFMRQISWRMAWLFAAHAALMFWAAKRRNVVWLGMREMIYPAALLLMLLTAS